MKISKFFIYMGIFLFIYIIFYKNKHISLQPDNNNKSNNNSYNKPLESNLIPNKDNQVVKNSFNTIDNSLRISNSDKNKFDHNNFNNNENNESNKNNIDYFEQARILSIIQFCNIITVNKT